MKISQMRCFSYRSVLWIVLLLFVSLLFPTHVSAQQHQITTGGPAILKVSVGFEGLYQDGNWVPVQVDLSNNGKDFNGKVAVSSPSMSLNNGSSNTFTNTYQEAIDLAPGSQKQVTLTVPIDLALQGSTAQLSIKLVDSTNHVVARKAFIPATNNSKLTLIGVLSDTPNNFSQLNLALSKLLKTSGQLQSLTAATLPSQAQVLQNFAALVIDNFTTSTLSQQQISALQSWVYQGGTLIVTGGPEWKRTSANLPISLLSVTEKSNGTLAGGTDLLPLLPVNDLTRSDQSANDRLTSAVPICIVQPTDGSKVLLSSKDIPIITQKNLGMGSTYYLAYDPTIEPLASWSQTSQIWSSILIRALANSMIASANTNVNIGSAGNTTTMSWQNASYNTSAIINLLQSFFPNTYPSIWLVLVLLISYVLILGPIRLLIVRLSKRRDWTWRIVLGTIVVFTLLSYGLALQQKGSAIINSSISVVQLQASAGNGTDGQMTTFVGVFVPNQGDFQVHVPGVSLVQPIDTTDTSYSNPGSSTSNQQSIFNVHAASTDVDLQSVNIWTTRTLIAQHDIHTAGTITSQLQLHQYVVSGTVSNSLPYTLSDAFVMMGNSYVSLGDLAAHSTKQVVIYPVHSEANPSIADQIATSRGIHPAMNIGGMNGYSGMNGYNSSDVPKDTVHSHALMLEAMSGKYCDNTSVCYNQNMPGASNNGVTTKPYQSGNMTVTQDPLLLPGSAATIIGWVPSSQIQSGDIMVNGQSTTNAQETLVQAPLTITMVGNVHIASSLITSQIVQLQQSSTTDIQEISPDTYTLANGNMTFEYSLPTNAVLKNSALTFTSSTNINSPAVPNPGATTDINSLQALLYNWRTDNWDTVLFKSFSCKVDNAQAYIGPGNRLLLHLSSHNATVLFDKPSLEAQVTVK